ncbi:MAG: RNA polymerase sigma factor [Chitinophagaceae bacterium]|nr:RNA polymerase sigma factor [Chitinophagaceae bacterium]
MPATITEFDLVQQLQQKNQAACRQLYDAYAAALYTVVKKRLSCHLAAEEVLQNVFVKIWINIDKYSRDKGSLYTWMQCIARNEAVDYTRSKHSRLSKLTDSLTGADFGIGDYYDTKFARLDLDRSIMILPHKNRVIIELSQLGFSCKEIGQLLKKPEGTIKTTMRSSYKMLRARLSDNKSTIKRLSDN